jgi:peptidylprolyl isomerase
VRGPRAAGAVMATLLLVLGCSDGDTADGDPEPETVESGDVEGKPTVEVPEDAAPPGDLQIEDLEEGDGEAVGDGTTLTVHVVGLRWSDGGEFLSSWDRGQPISHAFGEGRWVAGWEAGLEGMREGGRRRIIVPPELGYGERGAPGVPAGETLVFVVDLLDVA